MISFEPGWTGKNSKIFAKTHFFSMNHKETICSLCGRQLWPYGRVCKLQGNNMLTATVDCFGLIQIYQEFLKSLKCLHLLFLNSIPWSEVPLALEITVINWSVYGYLWWLVTNKQITISKLSKSCSPQINWVYCSTSSNQCQRNNFWPLFVTSILRLTIAVCRFWFRPKWTPWEVSYKLCKFYEIMQKFRQISNKST